MKGSWNVKKRMFMTYAGIVVLCVALDIILHVMTSSYSTIPENADFSTLAVSLGVEMTATLWALLAFSGVACVFHRFQHSIPGGGVMKGLRYGAAIALKWLVIFTFSAVFVFGRYMAYVTGIIQSGFHTRPFQTFIWTLLMSVCIGMVYLLLGQAATASTHALSAARFGCWIFGINWIVFLVFMPVLFNGFFTDFLVRAGVDILIVTTGSYLSIRQFIRCSVLLRENT
jgi:hypothetical protein